MKPFARYSHFVTAVGDYVIDITSDPVVTIVICSAYEHGESTAKLTKKRCHESLQVL